MTTRWNHLFNEKLFSNFTGIFSNYNYSLEGLFAVATSFKWDSNIINWTGKADFTYFPNPRHTVQFGLHAINHQFNPGEINPLKGSGIIAKSLERKSAWEPSFYVSDEFKFNDCLSFHAGLRYSRFYRTGKETVRQYANGRPLVLKPRGVFERVKAVGETVYGKGDLIKSFGGLEPRFSASYKISGRHAVKGSYNRMYQYIHLISNTASSTPLDIWSPSGPYKAPRSAIK